MLQGLDELNGKVGHAASRKPFDGATQHQRRAGRMQRIGMGRRHGAHPLSQQAHEKLSHALMIEVREHR